MKVTNKTFVDTVRRLVAANPDFIYEPADRADGCTYLEHDSNGHLVGSCLIGQALVALEVPIKVIQDHEGESIATAAPEMNLPLSDSVIAWAQSIQEDQDGQKSWGEALAAADKPELFKSA